MKRQMSRVAGEAALARSQNKVIAKAEASGLKRGTVEWNRFVYHTDHDLQGNMPKRKFRVQVQAQFDVEALNEEDACDLAVSQAVEMEPSEWGTLIDTDLADLPTRPTQYYAGYTTFMPYIEALEAQLRKLGGILPTTTQQHEAQEGR